jgi:hypothetical protein
LISKAFRGVLKSLAKALKRPCRGLSKVFGKFSDWEEAVGRQTGKSQKEGWLRKARRKADWEQPEGRQTKRNQREGRCIRTQKVGVLGRT